MMKRVRHGLYLGAATLCLGGCFATGMDFPDIPPPEKWFSGEPEKVDIAEAKSLEKWWLRFNDPALTQLIDIALKDSPSRREAEARILEARGAQKAAKASLFPWFGGSAAKGREDTAGLGKADDFYDARFDASFEVDVFGKNRKANRAANAAIRAREAEYHDVTLTLVADIARNYIAYRAYQKQAQIAQKNLDSQQKTLELIKNQFSAGEGNKLDVTRASNLVNTTQASIPEFIRLSTNARLRLNVLTAQDSETLRPVLDNIAGIPGADVKPVLMTPAEVLRARPDIRAAQEYLAASTALAESETAAIFPDFTLSGFYGVADSALISSATVWNVAAGAAVSLIDFGRIAGRIDVARAREVQAFEAYKQVVLEAVYDVETALNDYASVNRQRISLQEAYDDANESLSLSQQLFSEGEVSFLDLLDAQRVLNRADADRVSAEMAQAEALIRVYKSLGVY